MVGTAVPGPTKGLTIRLGRRSRRGFSSRDRGARHGAVGRCGGPHRGRTHGSGRAGPRLGVPPYQLEFLAAGPARAGRSRTMCPSDSGSVWFRGRKPTRPVPGSQCSPHRSRPRVRSGTCVQKNLPRRALGRSTASRGAWSVRNHEGVPSPVASRFTVPLSAGGWGPVRSGRPPDRLASFGTKPLRGRRLPLYPSLGHDSPSVRHDALMAHSEVSSRSGRVASGPVRSNSDSESRDR
jgi:hypothetical protein